MAAGSSKDGCVVPPESHVVGCRLKGDLERPQGVYQEFSTVDAIFIVISLITYILDLATDILLAWQFFSWGHSVCGVWTLVFVLVPTLTLQVLSIRWYVTEKQPLCCNWILVAHVFFLGPLQRYISVLQYGHKARQSKSPQAYKQLYQAQNDVSTLRFIEAHLEAAPQLILQGYFILTVEPLNWISGLSIAVSLLSLAWAVAAYSNALRLAYRQSYMTNWGGLLMQTLWHIGTVASRVLAIVVFASVFKAWTFLAIGLHWLAMSLWVFIQGPEFFTRWWENKLFSLVLGIVYIFCFLNLNDGQTRWKMWPYYVVYIAENGLLFGLWYWNRPVLDTLTIVVTVVVFGGYFLGVCFLLMYYRFCHPSGPIYLCAENNSDTQVKLPEEPVSKRIFDTTPLSPFSSNTGYDLSLELDSSWSGLVHSRRGDNPTFTTSRYQTSSRQLNFEGNNTLGRPNDACTKVFDTPLCGLNVNSSVGLCRQHSKTSGLLVLSDSGEGSQSYHLSDTCVICSTILSSKDNVAEKRNSRSSSFGMSSCSRLGCTSLSLSADLNSVNHPSENIGYDNAAFSVGSLKSLSAHTVDQHVIQHSLRAQVHTSSTPVLSMSLPALCHVSASNKDLNNPCFTLPRQQSSVYAITGVPRHGCRNPNLKRADEPRHCRKFKPIMKQNLKARKCHSTSHLFDHTQSLQCIPNEYQSQTLPLKPHVKKCRRIGSCDSLSSLSSNLRPRPLSPLNAQELWEESVSRYQQSFELETSNANQSEIADHSCYGRSKYIYNSRSGSMANLNQTSAGTGSTLNPSQASAGSLLNLNQALSRSQVNLCRTSAVNPIYQSPTPSLSNKKISGPVSNNDASSSENENSFSPVANVLLKTISKSFPTKTPDLTGEISQASDFEENSKRGDKKPNMSPNTTSPGNSQHHSLTSSVQSSGSSSDLSRSLFNTSSNSQGNFSAGGYRSNSSGFQSTSMEGSGDFFDYSDDSRDQSKHTLSDLALRLNKALDLNATGNNLSCRSSSDRIPQDKLYCLPYEYLFETSPYRDTPWRMDYQERITTPILRQSLLSLYSASEQSLSQASELNFINGSVHQGSFVKNPPTNPQTGSRDNLTFLNKGNEHLTNNTPLQIYSLANSPGCVRRKALSLYPERAPRKENSVVCIEEYANSPNRFHVSKTKKTDSPKQDYRNHIKDNKLRKESHTRKTLLCPNKHSGRPSSAQRRYIIPHEHCGPAPEAQSPPHYSKSPGSRGRYESADSSADSGRQSTDFSSSGSAPEDISYSVDTAESVDPNLPSCLPKYTPRINGPEFLSTTPDFSPIGRIDLPPLNVTGTLAPGQSYFSTPKASVPELNSPSILTDHDRTDDSFFGVKVPRLSYRHSNYDSFKCSSRLYASPLTCLEKDQNPKPYYASVKHVSVDKKNWFDSSGNSSNSSLSSSINRQRSPLQNLNITNFI